MQKYKWLVWKHNAAMMVFVRVKLKLEKIMEQLMAEHAKSRERTGALILQIKDEEEAQKFLEARHNQVTTHRDKIAAILE